jgi:predicted NUDIX family phosphoesterase
MGKNLYERRKVRASKAMPPPTAEELKALVVKRAEMFVDEYMRTEGWSRMCERKALLLNMAVAHYRGRRVGASNSARESP